MLVNVRTNFILCWHVSKHISTIVSCPAIEKPSSEQQIYDDIVIILLEMSDVRLLFHDLHCTMVLSFILHYLATFPFLLFTKSWETHKKVSIKWVSSSPYCVTWKHPQASNIIVNVPLLMLLWTCFRVHWFKSELQDV